MTGATLRLVPRIVRFAYGVSWGIANSVVEWASRYEYKMGCFAEFRGENDDALKLVCVALHLFSKVTNPD